MKSGLQAFAASISSILRIPQILIPVSHITSTSGYLYTSNDLWGTFAPLHAKRPLGYLCARNAARFIRPLGYLCTPNDLWGTFNL